MLPSGWDRSIRSIGLGLLCCHFARCFEYGIRVEGSGNSAVRGVDLPKGTENVLSSGAGESEGDFQE